MLVVDYAAERGFDLPVRFAALMHDLGKGATPAADWPSHHGHEGLGVKLIEALCKRLKVPNECRELAADDGARARQRQPRRGAAAEYHRHPVRALRRVAQAGALRPDAAGVRMRFPRPRRRRRRFPHQAISAGAAPAGGAGGGARASTPARWPRATPSSRSASRTRCTRRASAPSRPCCASSLAPGRRRRPLRPVQQRRMVGSATPDVSRRKQNVAPRPCIPAILRIDCPPLRRRAPPSRRS